MPRIAYYRWSLPSSTKPGKRHVARWLMTEETAAKYPGAQKVGDVAEWREAVTDPAEMLGTPCVGNGGSDDR